MERRLGTELDGLRRQAANEGRFAETIGVAVSVGFRRLDCWTTR